MEERLYCLTWDSTSAATSWTSATRALCAAALALTRAFRDAMMSSLRATACEWRDAGGRVVVSDKVDVDAGTGEGTRTSRPETRFRERARGASPTSVSDDGGSEGESEAGRNEGGVLARGCHDSVNVFREMGTNLRGRAVARGEASRLQTRGDGGHGARLARVHGHLDDDGWGSGEGHVGESRARKCRVEGR